MMERPYRIGRIDDLRWHFGRESLPTLGPKEGSE
jgi:hypothetical protein